MAVRQAANEELIASFLTGCDLLVQREGEVTVASGAGWRLTVLRGGDCGDPKRPQIGNKVQKMTRIVVNFCLQWKCVGQRKVSGKKMTLPEMISFRMIFFSQIRCNTRHTHVFAG